ncbi:CDP-alcohol phosphatidyltransferase-domain-containing protein [Suillus occidentalis]|nr:CDP-alcohol phosphatidyltransferase-domain-containing protein [Suillus occidentalis]
MDTLAFAPRSPATPPLRENIYTIPNLLTVSRILSCPVLGWSILHDDFFLATGLLVYAGLSDLADGYLARRFSMHSVLGTILDPAADKTLMTTLTVTLAMKGLLPVSLASIIIGRDVLLSLSAFYIRLYLPPRTSTKPFLDIGIFSIPSAEVRPTTISKVRIVVAVTTVWSGLSYVFSKDAVRIVSETRKKLPPL